MRNITMPLGIDSFEKIRTDGYCYVDKTGLIADLLKKRFEIHLITRPRRFGKTLAMDTLASFFDIRKDTKEIFAGLTVAREAELCAAWQNQWPVLFISLKEASGGNFEDARANLLASLSSLYKEHVYLLDSDKVDREDMEIFKKIQSQNAGQADIQNALHTLTRMMHAHFGKQVIVLIDEYDVPLARANERGYYGEMLEVIRGLMSVTLKTNPFLKFAVITGCLRIAKESIFTGTNNFVSDTIAGERFNEYFGFTQEEVRRLLKDTGFEEHEEETRRWYDGYHFGDADIYCPWDVLNHINALQDNPATPPKSYWENTSHNGILRTFIEMANNGERPDLDVNDKFEALLSGESIEEPVEENLTYDMLHSSESSLWSLLYLTGYLTQAGPAKLPEDGEAGESRLPLKIPNEEIKGIFRKTVVEWFRARILTTDRRELFEAMWEGDDKKATELISDLLFSTISYFDYREDFYHAFIAGIFAGGGYSVKSNRESGLGRTDIVIRDRGGRRVILIEIKRAERFDDLEARCEEAVRQMDRQRYGEEFEKGYRSVICYAMAFYNKTCLVRKFDKVER